MYRLGLAHSLHVCFYFSFFCVLLYNIHFHNNNNNSNNKTVVVTIRSSAGSK